MMKRRNRKSAVNECKKKKTSFHDPPEGPAALFYAAAFQISNISFKIKAWNEFQTQGLSPRKGSPGNFEQSWESLKRLN